jgi:hypothetical protein
MRPVGWYLGWTGHDNLGDEAMWEVCRRRFPNVAWHIPGPLVDSSGRGATSTAAHSSHETVPAKAIRILSEELRDARRIRAAASAAAQGMRRRVTGEVAILGGGTIIHHNYIDQYRILRRRTGRAVPVFASGVGKVEFWTKKRPAWRDRRREWVEAFSELPIVGVRGPISKALLQEAGSTNVEVVGDAALLMRPSTDVPSPRFERVDGPRRVGINVGITSLPPSPPTMWGDLDDVAQTLAALARRLLACGVDVELFAVWPMDLQVCRTVASLVGDARVTIASVFLDATVYMDYVQHNYDVVLAFKLHAGILAAAAGVPIVILAYRPKCLDFALSVGWDAFTRRTDIVNADWLGERVAVLLHDLPGARAGLAAAVVGVRARLERYCDQIAPLFA